MLTAGLRTIPLAWLFEEPSSIDFGKKLPHSKLETLSSANLNAKLSQTNTSDVKSKHHYQTTKKIICRGWPLWGSFTCKNDWWPRFSRNDSEATFWQCSHCFQSFAMRAGGWPQLTFSGSAHGAPAPNVSSVVSLGLWYPELPPRSDNSPGPISQVSSMRIVHGSFLVETHHLVGEPNLLSWFDPQLWSIMVNNKG